MFLTFQMGEERTLHRYRQTVSGSADCSTKDAHIIAARDLSGLFGRETGRNADMLLCRSLTLNGLQMGAAPTSVCAYPPD